MRIQGALINAMTCEKVAIPDASRTQGVVALNPHLVGVDMLERSEEPRGIDSEVGLERIRQPR